MIRRRSPLKIGKKLCLGLLCLGMPVLVGNLWAGAEGEGGGDGPMMPPITVCKSNQRDEVTNAQTLRYTICLRNLSGNTLNLQVTDTPNLLINLSSNSGMFCGGGGMGFCWRWTVVLEPGELKSLKLFGVVNGAPGEVLTNSLDVVLEGETFSYVDADTIVAGGEEDFYFNGLECGLGAWSAVVGGTNSIPVCKCDGEIYSDGFESGDDSAWNSTSG